MTMLWAYPPTACCRLKAAKEKSDAALLLLTPAAAALFGNFLAADLFQRAEIVLCELPHHRRCDAFVVVAQHVADAGHLLPWNFWMTRFRVRA